MDSLRDSLYLAFQIFVAPTTPPSTMAEPPGTAQTSGVQPPSPRSTLRSIWVWTSVTALIIIWLPLLAVIRVFDRDPARYTTGRWFRRLGMMMTRVNPSWRLQIAGDFPANPRNPYVVVSNHQSMADIPLLSNLPWEMKWIGKIELFRLPYIGWMMKLAGDIPVDRQDRRSGAAMLLRALRTLSLKCSVIFFPEGTRSPDGRLGKFNDGAFHLAVKAQVPLLPIALEGSYGCLPKKSWRFGPPQTILVRLLPPVPTAGLTNDDVPALRDRVRGLILNEVASLRGVPPPQLDVLAGQESPRVPAPPQ